MEGPPALLGKCKTYSSKKQVGFLFHLIHLCVCVCVCVLAQDQQRAFPKSDASVSGAKSPTKWVQQRMVRLPKGAYAKEEE